MHGLQSLLKHLVDQSKSFQEELFLCILVSSKVNRENPFEDVSEYNFAPFLLFQVLIFSDHQDKDRVLKSPVITDVVDLHLPMYLKRCSRFNKNESNSDLFRHRERKITYAFIFLLLPVISKSSASLK